MSAYYYFVASLIHLNYGDKPPISSEEFRVQCNNLLSTKDAALIPYCSYDPKLSVETVMTTGSDFIDLFLLRERVLNLNLAFLRAAKLKRPSPGDPPHDVPRAEAVAKAAVEMADPLEAALSIDRARWGSLDDMEGYSSFSENTIYAYLLKLQLLERKERFDAEKGAAEYRGLYNTILSEYNSKGLKEDR